jgi:hypothetical protein
MTRSRHDGSKTVPVNGAPPQEFAHAVGITRVDQLGLA